MRKHALIFDVEKCTDCNNCALAVQDEYVGNEFPGYSAEMPRHGHRWIDIQRKERGSAPILDVAYLAHMCQHCDHPPCARGSKSHAVRKREDGIVVIDPELAKGDRDLVDACPYGAIWWNEEWQVAQHWNFDAHLIDSGWTQPRCSQSCPTGAMRAVKVTDAELATIRKDEGLEELRPDLATGPRVLYKNLYRYNRAFVAGSVAIVINGVDECAIGAEVHLIRDAEAVAVVRTDAFGDFKIDGLLEDGAAYLVEVRLGGRTIRSDPFSLKASVYLGVFQLAGSALRAPASQSAKLSLGTSNQEHCVARFSGVDVNQANEKQREVADAMISGGRGHATGLMGLWLHHPDLAERTQLVGEFLRFKGVLPANIRELTILIVAREWRCDHEWIVHTPIAIEAGISPEAVEALRKGQRHYFENADERSVYDYVTEMLIKKCVSDRVYDDVCSRWGVPGVVELAALIGHYIIGAATLNAAKYGVPAQVQPPFEL